MKSPSFLRREEYAKLAGLTLTGKILDVGGAKRSGYHELIKGEHEIITGGIDPEYGLDVIFDAEEPWPFDAASFDAVLMINILEHLYRYGNALAEGKRVLRRGGRLVGVVPFMLNIHSAPHDHFRFTRFTLERVLKEYGFSNVTVEELGTGAFSVVYQAMLPFMKVQLLADAGIALARGLDGFSRRLKPHNNPLGKEALPLGYYFEAIA